MVRKQIKGQLIFFDEYWVEFCIKIKKIPRTRLSWDDYGISRERYRELRNICRSGRYHDIIRECAARANPYIMDQICLSVTHRKSYEGVEYTEWGRIPCGRTDFYGYRRLFYHLLDERMRENGEINKKR